jgi:branched-chain amino acid transport system substrate-binding protein
MTSHRHVLPGLIVSVAAALAIAGCGSSSSSSTSATSGGGAGASATSATATGSDIVLGNVGSYSGAQASSQAGVPMVLNAWASWVNAHGGLRGRQVKVITQDIGGNPAGGLAAVKQLVQQDHVVAIVGEEDNNDSSWASYIAGTGVPVIGGVSLDLPFVTNPDFFPIGTNIFADIYGEQVLAKSLGPKMGLLYCAESPQCAGLGPIHRGIAQATGLQIPVSAVVAATAPNYTAVCEQLKSSGVSSYSVGSGSAVTLRIAHECAAAGLKAKLLAGDGAVTTAWLTEPAANGALLTELDVPFFDDSIPASKEMQSALQQYAPGLGKLNGPTAAYSWVSGKLFEKAVAAIPAGTAITPASIKAGLYTLRNETLGGLTPPLTFTQDKPTVINCYFVMGVSNGKFTEPQGLKTSCAPDAVVNGVLASFPKN